ncbi:uncharacterized protein LOC130260722 [Oenanthe melanoleuca]|uniref:uncharacterized protein LOC130260722 n=1 Tax=Oenanthe melanoleuca TaxID=2939378 RepID=UPI0024C1ED4F|nr:uncharacterized protein LOC130260722 [Oenanthe melanoleuca]
MSEPALCGQSRQGLTSWPVCFRRDLGTCLESHLRQDLTPLVPHHVLGSCTDHSEEFGDFGTGRHAGTLKPLFSSLPAPRPHELCGAGRLLSRACFPWIPRRRQHQITSGSRRGDTLCPGGEVSHTGFAQMCRCCVTPSHPIPSHPIPSHPIPSHPIPSHPIPSHPIPSHPIPSHPIPSHPIPSRPAHPGAASAGRPRPSRESPAHQSAHSPGSRSERTVPVQMFSGSFSQLQRAAEFTRKRRERKGKSPGQWRAGGKNPRIP